MGGTFNTLRPRQNRRHFADDIFQCIFLNENVCIPIKISLKFVPKGPINNIPALVQIMAWRRPAAKPLSKSMMVSLLTHICVTRPQWVNTDMWGILLWLYSAIFGNLKSTNNLDIFCNTSSVPKSLTPGFYYDFRLFNRYFLYIKTILILYLINFLRTLKDCNDMHEEMKTII